ncbi:MAG: kelch repeat-containing protein [Thermoplasmatota archaeon]
MRKQTPNRLKVPIIILLSLLLAFNLQALVPSADGTDEIDEDYGDSRILTDDEVSDLGLAPPPGAPTRSEPWNTWQRFHYPSGGENGAVVYFSPANRIYVYGGGYPGWQDSLNGYDDLFYFDLASETWNSLERSFSPGGRGYFGDAYDSVNMKLYVYGGMQSNSMMDDLWEFDLNTEQWSRLSSGLLESTYPRRARAPMVVDTVSNPPSLYIHMGLGDQSQGNENLSGFYRIDLTSPTPTINLLQDGSATGLLKRYEHDMCIDSVNRKIYMYGGYNEDMGYLTEFWVYDIISNQWQFIPTHPDMYRLFGSRMFYRPSDGTVNIWGGLISGNTESEELWTYDTALGTWSNRSFSDAPSGRLYYTNHYSADVDRFVVFAGRYYGGGGGGSSRYRDLNYLDLPTMDWTSFPLTYSANSVTNGIFAFDSARQRIYYIGPNTGYWNSTNYIYYFDIAQKLWMGPYYNPGAENPRSRSNAGLCFDARNMTVYMYGGGWTTGQGPNTRYYEIGDVWKLNLNTYVWTELMSEAGPGPRQGNPMIFNPTDGRIYMYGGYLHPSETSSQTEIYNDFYRFDPLLKIFQPLSLAGSTPGDRYGSGLVHDPENNYIYVMGGTKGPATTPTEKRDLWRYDVRYGLWKELSQTTSSRTYPKLEYDPLTKELFMTGGANDDFVRYRILEDKWYSDWYPVPNPGTLTGHASHFDPVSRDLWVFGGGGQSGIWKMGLPPRLAIQTAKFKDPDGGSDIAYAMYRPYTFTTSVKMVNGAPDLSRIEMELPHRQGAFRLTYNHTIAESGGNGWTEWDPLDLAEVVGTPSVSWKGLFIDIEFKVLFHWNWTNRPNAVDRTIKVEAFGIDVSPDELIVRDFLRVRANLKFRGNVDLYGFIQGTLKEKDWVQTDEDIQVSGPIITYADTNQFFPPVDTFSLDFWVEGENVGSIDITPGQPINFTYTSLNISKIDVPYTLNISGVNEATGDEELAWNLSMDGIAPGAPGNLRFHDEDPEATVIVFDNDLHSFLTWQAPTEDMSGILQYYWAFEDNGGTRDGTPANSTQLELNFEEAGEKWVYIWTEDEVGNIGPATGGKLLIDMDGIQFEVLRPKLNQTIPYDTIDVEIRMTDLGGSHIVSQTIQYRYSYDGQGDENWIGQDAWKYMPELWTSFQKDVFQFNITIGRNGIPKLSDSDENYLQVRAKDGAGTTYLSPVYNIDVDTSLRFPSVNLTSPADKSQFDDAEDVTLEWTVDFFAPEDVVYHIYISNVKAQVELWDETVKIDSLDLSYKPNFLTFGKYYWTVIPVARGQWTGSCESGIWDFTITDDSSFQFTVETDTSRVHKYRQGQAGIPISFQITNHAKSDAWILPNSDLKGVGTINWQELDPQQNKYKVIPDQTKDVTGLLNIMSSSPVYTYELEFYFVNQWGINKTVTISVEVLPAQAGDDDDDGPDTNVGVIVGFGIVGVIVLMMIIAAVYFLVIKKKKTGHKASEAHLDRLEQEMMSDEKPLSTTLAMAPQPKGLGTTTSTRSGKLPVKGEGTPDLEELDEFEEEEVRLAEDGSEDEWMNIVAAETVAAEMEDEIVEDTMVKEDKNKSLQDLLAEMSGGMDEEED